MENEELVEKPSEDLEDLEEQKMLSRRDFLSGLRKWSAAVVGVAVAGAVLLPGKTASGWVNGRGGGGGSWVNRAGGGGGWVNGGGGGGGSWVNRRGY